MYSLHNSHAKSIVSHHKLFKIQIKNIHKYWNQYAKTLYTPTKPPKQKFIMNMFEEYLQSVRSQFIPHDQAEIALINKGKELYKETVKKHPRWKLFYDSVLQHNAIKVVENRKHITPLFPDAPHDQQWLFEIQWVLRQPLSKEEKAFINKYLDIKYG